MRFNDNHSRVNSLLTEDDREFLRNFIPKNERAVEVFTKFLENYTRESRVNSSDANWAIKRAMKDGQDQLVESWNHLFSNK